MNKSIDPFHAREAGRYKEPITSREAIIGYMEAEGCPVAQQQVAKHFQLNSEQQREALRRRLAAMERDGQILKNRKGEYALVDQLALVRGVVIRHKDGLAFVQGESGEAVALSPRASRTLMVDDTVLVRVGSVPYYGRKKGTLIDILSRGHTSVVGRYVEESDMRYVQLSNSIMQSDIILLSEGGISAQVGEYAVVHIDRYPQEQQQACGKIIEIIGVEDQSGFEIDLAIHTYEIPHQWPVEVVEQTRQFPETVSEADCTDRVDLRHLPFITIDAQSARDFDDAVYVEALPEGGWTLWVAIADVGYYVPVGTPIDLEAQKRGTSVYFPQRVIPMLPEALSDQLCSLQPDCDRLAVVARLDVNQAGEVTTSAFLRAVIHSHARLTYIEVIQMCLNQMQVPDWLSVPLSDAVALHEVLKVLKNKRGAIEFDLTETEVQYDQHGKIEQIVPTERGLSHEMIENFMLLANAAVATALSEGKKPALFRVHPSPEAEKVEVLKKFLALVGVKMKGKSEKISSKMFNQVLNQVHDREDFERIQSLLLRTLSQAVYQPEDHGHFGLAYQHYTHFTSPIRRYPDLVVHRAVCAYLIDDTEKGPHYEMSLVALGRHCSMLERRADLAVRDTLDRLKCHFMQDKIGEHFDGTVVSVTGFGLFVRLNAFFVEGLVHVTDLYKDYYLFDEVMYQLVGQRTGQVYRIGTPLRIQVVKVNTERGHIDFALSTSSKSASKL
jgi:ribonuclease R